MGSMALTIVYYSEMMERAWREHASQLECATDMDRRVVISSFDGGSRPA